MAASGIVTAKERASWRLWSVLTIALATVSCDVGPAGAPSTQRLVDLFDRAGTQVVGSPTLRAAPRAAWRFTDAPDDNPVLSWTTDGGIADLHVTAGRLTGVTTNDRPILHLKWRDPGGPDDQLRSVEIELRTTAGANLEVELRNAEDSLENLQTEDWSLSTPIIPGEESRTYSISDDGNTDVSAMARPDDRHA